jgi:hypothetical protein
MRVPGERLNGQCIVDDRKSSWYRFKRRAIIQPIEESLPRNTIGNALGKISFVPTIQAINRDGFERLAEVLRAEFGVSKNV